MIRGLLFGAVAFGAAVLLERQSGSVLSDMRRYDKIRAMSGDPPLYREGLHQLFSWFAGMRQASHDNEPGFAPHGKARDKSMFDTVREDIQRYATIRAM